MGCNRPKDIGCCAERRNNPSPLARSSSGSRALSLPMPYVVCRVPAWSRGKRLLRWVGFGKGGTGRHLQSPWCQHWGTEPHWVKALTNQPLPSCRKVKMRKICHHWDIIPRLFQHSLPKASLSSESPFVSVSPEMAFFRLIEQQPPAVALQGTNITATFPVPKWHFQGQFVGYVMFKHSRVLVFSSEVRTAVNLQREQ